jgi:hypothetical protein
MPVDVIEALILQRDAARERKDFDAADGFRDALRTAGVKVDDRNGGWACKDGRSGKQLPGGGFAATTANTNTNTNAKANTVPATAAAAVSSAGSGSAERSHYGAWEGYGLDEVLLKSLRRLGFSAPTTVQSMCLSASIAGRKDVAAAAPTGSGKTLAFGLPIMHQLLLQARGAAQKEGGDAVSFFYRYISRESCSQFDSLPRTYFTISLRRCRTLHRRCPRSRVRSASRRHASSRCRSRSTCVQSLRGVSSSAAAPSSRSSAAWRR